MTNSISWTPTPTHVLNCYILRAVVFNSEKNIYFVEKVKVRHECCKITTKQFYKIYDYEVVATHP